MRLYAIYGSFGWKETLVFILLFSVFGYISHCLLLWKVRIFHWLFLFKQNVEQTNLYRLIEFLCTYKCYLLWQTNIVTKTAIHFTSSLVYLITILSFSLSVVFKCLTWKTIMKRLIENKKHGPLWTTQFKHPILNTVAFFFSNFLLISNIPLQNVVLTILHKNCSTYDLDIILKI